MPIYEYMCNCGRYEEKLEFGKEIDGSHICPDCSENMSKMVSLTSFKLEYNNKTDMCDWSGNTSHYWDDYKKAREEGKDVKPIINGDKY